jgi:hypothetical protein
VEHRQRSESERPDRRRSFEALLPVPWAVLWSSSWEGGTQAAEGEHGQADEGELWKPKASRVMTVILVLTDSMRPLLSPWSSVAWMLSRCLRIFLPWLPTISGSSSPSITESPQL